MEETRKDDESRGTVYQIRLLYFQSEKKTKGNFFSSISKVRSSSELKISTKRLAQLSIVEDNVIINDPRALSSFLVDLPAGRACAGSDLVRMRRRRCATAHAWTLPDDCACANTTSAHARPGKKETKKRRKRRKTYC